MFYGPPGAGKGTQANLLAGKLGMVHFDTGKFIEQVVHDPANQNDQEIQRERRNFDTGVLTTPSWILKIVKKKSEEIAKSGFGLVFSGSPRTVFEAFGDEKNEGLISSLERLYGKENVVPIFLDIDPKISILRNKNRKICEFCGAAILYNDETHAHSTCPICGGKLYKRAVDNPEVFETRIKEYQDRTAPVLAGLEERGYEVFKVDAKSLPYNVSEEVLRKLKSIDG